MSSADLSSFTIEQLQEALKQKIPPSISAEPEKNCMFQPIKTPKEACTEKVSVTYGSRNYCKKHSRTVQCLNAKKAWEETQVEPPVVEEPRVVEPVKVVSTPEAKSEPEVKPKVEITEEIKPEVKVEEPKKEVKENVGKSKEDHKSAKLKAMPVPEPVVIKKKITPNKWGRFEEPDTHIVFDPKTKAAFGVQDYKSGKVLALSKKHIALCKKYKWKYFIIDTKDDDEEEESGEEEEESGEEEEESGDEEEQSDEEEESREEEEESGDEEEQSDEEEEESGDEEEQSDEEEERGGEEESDEEEESGDEEEESGGEEESEEESGDEEEESGEEESD